MTWLADAPREIVHVLVSTTRAVGHPREHFDHHTACRAAISCPDHSSHEDSVESEEGQVENDEEHDDEVLDGESTQEDFTDEVNESHVNGSTQSSSIERKRNLQLEKAKTMSSSMTSSKPQKVNLLYEASFHGSKVSKKFLRLIIWLPTDVSLSMARGFHNAPKLYHDPTVNDIPQVISIRSGLRVAGKVVSAIPAPARAKYSDICTGAQRWILLGYHGRSNAAALWFQA